MYVNIVYYSRTELAACGIGIHHAGMSMDDRRATEDLYLRKLLRILFATSVSRDTVMSPCRLHQSLSDSGSWCEFTCAILTRVKAHKWLSLLACQSQLRIR